MLDVAAKESLLVYFCQRDRDRECFNILEEPNTELSGKFYPPSTIWVPPYVIVDIDARDCPLPTIYGFTFDSNQTSLIES
jgi:hypothetical protein